MVIMAPHKRMTPQERIQAAQRLRKRANGEPGLKIAKLQDLRRIASNLMALNLWEAKQKKPG